jgi:hypothetical protein
MSGIEVRGMAVIASTISLRRMCTQRMRTFPSQDIPGGVSVDFAEIFVAEA